MGLLDTRALRTSALGLFDTCRSRLWASVHRDARSSRDLLDLDGLLPFYILGQWYHCFLIKPMIHQRSHHAVTTRRGVQLYKRIAQSVEVHL